MVKVTNIRSSSILKHLVQEPGNQCIMCFAMPGRVEAENLLR